MARTGAALALALALGYALGGPALAQRAAPQTARVRPRAAARPRPQARNERTANIERHRADIVRGNRFNIRRDLSDYGTGLGPHFGPFLTKLGEGAHWIDAGAGLAYAHRQYARFGKARMTSVSLTRPADATLDAFEREMKPQGYRYLSGQLIEDYPAARLGRARLVTDLYGPAVYTSDLGKVLTTYAEVLEPGGRVYLLLDSRTRFERNGKASTFEDWLAAAKGFRLVDRGAHEDRVVTRHRLEQGKPPTPEQHVEKTEYPGATWYVIEKTAARAELPGLALHSFEATPIPTRVFRW